jgi:hypothetical protein
MMEVKKDRVASRLLVFVFECVESSTIGAMKANHETYPHLDFVLSNPLMPKKNFVETAYFRNLFKLKRLAKDSHEIKMMKI